jgi:hypothetical protein
MVLYILAYIYSLVVLYLTCGKFCLFVHIHSYALANAINTDIIKIVSTSGNTNVMDALLSETTENTSRRCEHCNPHPQRPGVTTRRSGGDNQEPCVIHDCIICTTNEEGVVVSSYPNTAVWPPLLVKCLLCLCVCKCAKY